MTYWPLAVSPYTFLDRIKVAAWMLSTDRYTMGVKVAEFERVFGEYAGAYAVAVSSGSAANTMLFEIWKMKNPGKRPIVIAPAVTWGSSITPPLMAGMDVRFCDVNLDDFCFDYDKLEQMLIVLAHHKPGSRKRECDVIIWPTALIGFVPDMVRLQKLADRYGAELFLDSCENSLSFYEDRDGMPESILASCSMTTTSCYFAHQIVAIEFGFVFFRNAEDALAGKMFRTHGLSRALPQGHPLRIMHEGQNPDIDPEFLFIQAGTNLRPTELNAAFGLLDFKRRDEVASQRVDLYRHYRATIDLDRYFLPPINRGHVPFCLPVFVREKKDMPQIKARLRSCGIDTRPVVGGCLPMHPAFSHLGNPRDFPNAKWIHEHGFYIGIHRDLRRDDIDRLISILDA